MSRGRKKFTAIKVLQEILSTNFIVPKISFANIRAAYRAVYIVRGMLTVIHKDSNYTNYYSLRDSTYEVLSKRLSITKEDIKHKNIIVLWEYKEQ